MAADIQGFLVVLTLDGNDITVQCTRLAVDRSKASLKKSTMDGTGSPEYIPGEETGQLGITGSVIEGAVAIEALEETWAKAAEVPFSVLVGDGATVDAGTYSGDTLLQTFNVGTEPSDTWSFDMVGDTGKIVYTPPTP